MSRRRLSPKLRDEITAYLSHWRNRTGVALVTMLGWLALSEARYYAWQKPRPAFQSRVPKNHWLLPSEVEAIVAYRQAHLDDGWRPLGFVSFANISHPTRSGLA